MRCGVTSLCAPPTVWRVLILEDLAQWPVKLSEVIGAGEPLNPEVIERVRAAWGLTLRDGYGQTESTCMVGNPPGLEVRAGSMGQPMPGYRMVLLDAEDREADEGELAVTLDPAPTGLMAGYAGDAEKTAGCAGRQPTTAPATSPVATPTATCGTSAAPTTCSRPATTASAPSSWRARCSNTRPWPRPRWCRAPTRSSWRCPRPTSCSSPGRPRRARRRWTSCASCAAASAPYKRVRRIEFAELPKTISGKIRRVQLRQAEDERRARGERGALEFWEEDFAELK